MFSLLALTQSLVNFETNNILMKSSLLILFCLLAAFSQAQYYYKDIVGTRETADLIKNYRNNKVSRVVLTSYDAENTKKR